MVRFLKIFSQFGDMNKVCDVLFCPAILQVQQIFRRPFHADWIGSPSPGYFSRLSLSAEPLPETGCVDFEKGDRTAPVSP